MIATTKNHNIFVLASSAGGIETLKTIISRLPADFPGSIFITQHTSPLSRKCYLTEILQRYGKLTCVTAEDHQSINPGRIYIAPPDNHLLIRDDHIHTSRGPKENHSRPAADPMFRSAAASHGGRVVGIVLTGYLDDGSSGLLTVKSCGGKTVVQDPLDAIVPDMPTNAMSYTTPDFVAPAAGMATVMCELAATEAGPSNTPSQAVLAELKFIESFNSDIAAEEFLGHLSPFMCPDCNGQLWRSEVDAVPRFRCHVGHGHTMRSLIEAQRDASERSAWATLRTLKEQVATMHLMAEHERQLGNVEVSESYLRRARIAETRARHLRNSFETFERLEPNETPEQSSQTT